MMVLSDRFTGGNIMQLIHGACTLVESDAG